MLRLQGFALAGPIFLKQFQTVPCFQDVTEVENEKSYRWQPLERPTVRPQETADMPVLSKFYGIVIRMLFARALEARFHAFYQDSELVVGIWPLRIIDGDAPARVRQMVLEWAAQHQQELLSAWLQCEFRQAPIHIAPLQ